MQFSKKEKSDPQAGYTLTELLVVLVIIALLTGLVAPRLLGRIGGAKGTTAKTQIENLISALELYRLDIGHYPTQDQGLKALVEKPDGVEPTNWQGPYLRKQRIPLDPWKRDFIYSLSEDGEHVSLITLGKDGQTGGDGENSDISNDS